MKKLTHTKANQANDTAQVLADGQLRHVLGGGSWGWVGKALNTIGLGSRDESGDTSGSTAVGVRG